MRIQASPIDFETLNQLLVPAAQNRDINDVLKVLRLGGVISSRKEEDSTMYSTALQIAYTSGHHSTVE